MKSQKLIIGGVVVSVALYLYFKNRPKADANAEEAVMDKATTDDKSKNETKGANDAPIKTKAGGTRNIREELSQLKTQKEDQLMQAAYDKAKIIAPRFGGIGLDAERQRRNKIKELTEIEVRGKVQNFESSYERLLARMKEKKMQIKNERKNRDNKQEDAAFAFNGHTF